MIFVSSIDAEVSSSDVICDPNEIVRESDYSENYMNYLTVESERAIQI